VSASPRALLLFVAGALSACSGKIDAPDGGGEGGGGVASAGVSAASGSAGHAIGGGGGAAGQAGQAGMSGGVAGSGAGGVGGTGGGGASSLQADATLLALQNSGVTGTAHFVGVLDQVSLNITLAGCPAGPHAVHLHANAACDDQGNAAGGHWSPQGEGLGDVMCGADGVAQFSFNPPSGTWTIGGAAATDLLPHAVVLHAGSNLDPGARIACGIPQKLP
jgi:Cu/Zn superoxide dismutase